MEIHRAKTNNEDGKWNLPMQQRGSETDRVMRRNENESKQIEFGEAEFTQDSNLKRARNNSLENVL